MYIFPALAFQVLILGPKALQAKLDKVTHSVVVVIHHVDHVVSVQESASHADQHLLQTRVIVPHRHIVRPEHSQYNTV